MNPALIDFVQLVLALGLLYLYLVLHTYTRQARSSARRWQQATRQSSSRERVL